MEWVVFSLVVGAAWLACGIVVYGCFDTEFGISLRRPSIDLAMLAMCPIIVLPVLFTHDWRKYGWGVGKLRFGAAKKKIAPAPNEQAFKEATLAAVEHLSKRIKELEYKIAYGAATTIKHSYSLVETTKRIHLVTGDVVEGSFSLFWVQDKMTHAKGTIEGQEHAVVIPANVIAMAEVAQYISGQDSGYLKSYPIPSLTLKDNVFTGSPINVMPGDTIKFTSAPPAPAADDMLTAEMVESSIAKLWDGVAKGE